jgi:hypothetical protein
MTTTISLSARLFSFALTFTATQFILND